MSWLLPVTIVLLASLALAAVHLFFTRYLARSHQNHAMRSGPTPPHDATAHLVK